MKDPGSRRRHVIAVVNVLLCNILLCNVLLCNVLIVSVLIRAQAGHSRGFKVWQQQGSVLQQGLRIAAF